jgi:hypothetical protein
VLAGSPGTMPVAGAVKVGLATVTAVSARALADGSSAPVDAIIHTDKRFMVSSSVESPWKASGELGSPRP